MKVEITKELENEIEAMIGVAKSAASIRKNNPAIWHILTGQFLPDNSYGKPHIPDTDENLKIRLYAEIMRKKNETQVLVERKVEVK